MALLQERNFGLDTSAGLVTGHRAVLMEGMAEDADAGEKTDVWVGADLAGTGPKIWLPTQQARSYSIVSDSALDTLLGAGMRTVRVEGIPNDWDSDEITEVVEMNGTTPAITANSYVIVNRLNGMTFGEAGSNFGIITGTATTEDLVLAVIQPGDGNSLQAILGIPSTQEYHVVLAHAGITGVGAQVGADARLAIKVRADQTDAAFSAGIPFRLYDSVNTLWVLDPPRLLTGPMIVKIQVVSGSNNSSVSGFFNGYLRVKTT